MGNRKYCHPLTIADSYSRYLFTAKGLYGECFVPTKQEFKRIFREYGQPRQIHTDNGRPFGAVQAIQRLTRLSVWFLGHDIEPVYSALAHPEQNGRHERMHRDLKGEATRPSAYNLRTQQRKLNSFVNEYNNKRTHTALALEPPRSVHVRSQRQYRDKIDEWIYPSHFQLRQVCKNGALRWRSKKWVWLRPVYLGKALVLKRLGQGYGAYFSGVNCLAILMRGRCEFKINSDVLRETMCKRCIDITVNDQMNCTKRQGNENSCDKWKSPR